MMSPVFLGLHETFPLYQIELITDSTFQRGALIDLAKRNPYIDVVHDVPVSLSTTFDTYFTQQLAANPGCGLLDDTIGDGLYVDLNNVCLQIERTMPDPPHRTDIWCETASVNPSSYVPICVLTKKEKKAGKELIASLGKPRVGVALTAADKARALSAATVHALLAELTARGLQPVTIDAFYSVPGYPAIVGKPILETMAAIAALEAVISVDTGVLHMAGAMDVPLVGLFGSIPASKRMAYYRGEALQAHLPCSPCWYRQSCRSLPEEKHFECMSMFTVEQIVESTERVLGV